MKESFLIFKKFPSPGQASELKELLKENGIESVLGDNIPTFDVSFSGNTLQNEYEVRIKQSDFEKAREILEKNAGSLLGQIDGNYYLFGFSDKELYEILLKWDEWSAFDYALAQRILKQRGKTVGKELLDSLRKERLKDLAKPEENQGPWIVAGYALSIFGGLFGLVIGYFLWTSKKALPNGQMVYSYSENDRKHGRRIFFIGSVVFPVGLALKLLNQF